MLNKLNHIIQDPVYYGYLLRKRLYQLAPDFALTTAFRSDSDDGEYTKVIRQCLQSTKKFNNFKRAPAYRHILEHVSTEQGACYLEILKARDDGLLDSALASVLQSDDVGNPIKANYDAYAQPLSPTTLRYVKVASDCMHLFGKGLHSIAEIGCGYGGQCLVNDQLLKYQSATLFDLPVVNQLIKRYLDSHLMHGAFEVATINEKMPEAYDLVISNYAFSELPSALQEMYIDKVLAKAKRGYLTMNSGIGGPHDQGKLSLETLKAKLPSFECISEEPQTADYNYIIVWGHDTAALNKHFKQKVI